ncbi:MAG: ribonuclease H-like domain-containing protein [Ardenticatenales bacterium]|nr:ribonuclease H-like domain-containing protein [Ardenticatenales bacterium]
MSQNVVIFDLETQRDIASVGGRDYLERLGVSVGVAYHVGEGRFYHFDESQMGELVALLQRADLVVGYNIRHFDFRVLSAYTEANLSALPTCDLLEEIERVLGHRVKLDTLAKNTLGLRKSADGIMALQWWREGQVDLIRDYCQQDVDVTRRLWEYGHAHGHLWYWDHQQNMRRPVPVQW